jgi:hypothetical protein
MQTNHSKQIENERLHRELDGIDQIEVRAWCELDTQDEILEEWLNDDDKK